MDVLSVVFSSSATVYGADPVPITEESPVGVGISKPYARSKNMLGQVPYSQQVASGRRPFLSVFGNDYPTPDGTGVRDYIHIYDLAQGHLKAVQYLFGKMEPGTEVFNLGTGHGYSVLEMLHAMVGEVWGCEA